MFVCKISVSKIIKIELGPLIVLPTFEDTV